MWEFGQGSAIVQCEFILKGNQVDIDAEWTPNTHCCGEIYLDIIAISDEF